MAGKATKWSAMATHNGNGTNVLPEQLVDEHFLCQQYCHNNGAGTNKANALKLNAENSKRTRKFISSAFNMVGI